MAVHFSGYISPIPGSLPDNSDQWTQYSINNIKDALAPNFTGVQVLVDPVDPGLGVQTVHVSAIPTGTGDSQILLTNAVAGSGVNLDLSSVKVYDDGAIAADTSGRYQPLPVALVGNPNINADGSVNVSPMTIDYSAPYAPPQIATTVVKYSPILTGDGSDSVPQILTTPPLNTDNLLTSVSDVNSGPVTVATGSRAPSGSDNTLVPVVVTTTPAVNPPLPTLPPVLVPIVPASNPYYVPGAVAPAATPALQPHSPDPASNIVNGTPIQTPNLPASTTSVAIPTNTISIGGVQVNKTFALVVVITGLWFLGSRK